MQSLGSGLEVNAVLVQKGEVGGKELLVHAQGAPMLEATPLTIYPLRHFFLIKEDKYSNSTLGFSGTLNLHCNFLESV